MDSTTSQDPLQQWLDGEGAATVFDRFTREAPDVVGVVDRQLIVRYVNWTAPGLTVEGVIGMPVLDLTPPDYHEIAERTYRRVLTSGEPDRFEVMFEDDNQVLMWDVRVGPIRQQGEVIGLLTISTEVTEQRRAEADRDRFFSLSLDMLVVCAPSGHFKRLNPAFGEALGYETSELVGMHFLDLLHPDDVGHATASFETLIRGTPVTSENRCRRKDGEYRVLSWRATVDPITNDAYAVARDVTDQRAAEALLHRAQKMEAVGQLAGGIAHDFNNLTQAILGNVEVARMDSAERSPTLEECLRGIDSAASRAAALTKQLLAFSRRQRLEPVPVDLGALIQDLTAILRRLLPAHIAIDMPSHQAQSFVNADPSQLEQVVLNLCVNARDAMASGGTLTIETDDVALDEHFCEAHPWARPGRFVCLRVSDTGAGMAREVRERIFEPFYTTKGAHQGTGLGLSTVYGIVMQHGGLITVDSAVGRGTTFEIYLPAQARAPLQKREDHPAAPARGRETILVAEDTDAVRRVMVTILERAGYRVLATPDGQEAVRHLHECDEPLHLAVLDMSMPRLSGPEAWKRMREIRPELRVLFVSGYAGEEHLDDLPPDAEVIGKPFRAERLLRSVRAVLES